jgi:transposase InsO family protein
VKYAWIEKMSRKRLWWFSVVLACELLEVSRSGFYDWRSRRGRPATAAERQQRLLVAAITVEHIASKRRYGSPRIHAELVDQGWRVGVNRIARIMRAHGLQGRSGRLRRHSLTRQARVAPDIPDLVCRNFTVEQPNTTWATDITYVPTAQGWLYLAVIIDLCSRAVVGWAAETHMRTELVLEALTMALTARQPGRGLIV